MRNIFVLSGFVVVAGAQAGGITFEFDQGLFRERATIIGKTMKGFEDFEESFVGSGSGIGMDDPLNAATNNGIFALGTIEENLTIQSNSLGGNASTASPRGLGGLGNGRDVGGIASSWIIANLNVDSLDAIFSTPKTAVGFNVVNFVGAAPTNVDIKVFGPGDVLLGSTTVVAGSSITPFVGVISSTPISRINVFSNVPGSGGTGEGFDNIEMWEAVPEPASMAALALGAVALIRKRRKSS